MPQLTYPLIHACRCVSIFQPAAGRRLRPQSVCLSVCLSDQPAPGRRLRPQSVCLSVCLSDQPAPGRRPGMSRQDGAVPTRRRADTLVCSRQYHANGPDQPPIEIDFRPPWPRISMVSALEKALGVALPADLESEEARLALAALVGLVLATGGIARGVWWRSVEALAAPPAAPGNP
jgi:hypothetical protein